MLRNNKISCLHNGSFTGLSNVRLLSLYDNQLSVILPGTFDALPNLSTLSVMRMRTLKHTVNPNKLPELVLFCFFGFI